MNERLDHKRLNDVQKDPFRDEYYTPRPLADEMVDMLYGNVTGKTVYCNCDEPVSEIYKALKDNSTRLGLKRLLATSYRKNGHGTRTEWDG